MKNNYFHSFLIKAIKNTKMRILAAVLLFATGMAQAQTPIFVKATGTAGTGSSWDSPLIGYAGLQTAVATAGTTGSHIHVAAGTYTPTASGQSLYLTKNQSYYITGGYPASATGTDISGYNPVANESIVSGVTGKSVFTADDFASGPNGVNKSALALSTESLYITGMQFNNNSGGHGQGAVLYNAGGATPFMHIFTQCSFIGNASATVYNYGGALSYLGGDSNATIVFEGCYFNGNSAYTGSGAGYQGGGALGFWGVRGVEIKNSSFVGNISRNGYPGGAVASIDSDVIIDNSSFCDNHAEWYPFPSATSGGALYFSSTVSGANYNVIVKNSTFLNNHAVVRIDSTTPPRKGQGGAISAVGLTPVIVDSCLFYGNMVNTSATNSSTTAVGADVYGNSNLTVSNSYLQNASSSYTFTSPNYVITLGSGNHYSGDLTGTTVPEDCPTSVVSPVECAAGDTAPPLSLP